MSIGDVNLLLEKTALRSGINIVYGLKGLRHRSISYQSLILFGGKDLPRLWLGIAWKVLFMNPYIRKKKGTYEEKTSKTDSIRIKENNELESKTDELEGKTNDAIHYSFKEQASKMPKNFLKQ